MNSDHLQRQIGELKGEVATLSARLADLEALKHRAIGVCLALTTFASLVSIVLAVMTFLHGAK